MLRRFKCVCVFVYGGDSADAADMKTQLQSDSHVLPQTNTQSAQLCTDVTVCGALGAVAVRKCCYFAKTNSYVARVRTHQRTTKATAAAATTAA